jgi:hypothetical protein
VDDLGPNFSMETTRLNLQGITGTPDTFIESATATLIGGTVEITINGTMMDKNAFKQGFVRGWLEHAGDVEKNKIKLRAMAETAFLKYLRDRGIRDT